MQRAPESSSPTDPFTAVTDPDPAAYYSALAARRMHRDDRLGIWVASSAADVAEALTSPGLKVRPVGEPVPRHLVGTAAGDVFGRLARMTDGPHHHRVKAGLDAVFAALDPVGLDDVCAAAVDELAALIQGLQAAELVERWMAAYPTLVITRLFGIQWPDLDTLVDAARDLAACFAPGAPPDRTAAGHDAAATLSEFVRGSAGLESGVAAMLMTAFGVEHADDATANVAGLFFQAFDATAGLIGSTVARLAVRRVDGETALAEIEDVVAGVLRRDPPVQNTRRFVHRDDVVCGQHVAAGDVVLIVLAAANRDPACSEPLSFGAGAHRCPAHALAPMVASHAVAGVLRVLGGPLAVTPHGYRPSVNARVPTFTGAPRAS